MIKDRVYVLYIYIYNIYIYTYIIYDASHRPCSVSVELYSCHEDRDSGSLSSHRRITWVQIFKFTCSDSKMHFSVVAMEYNHTRIEVRHTAALLFLSSSSERQEAV
jgi:hypothetical protein